jgi:hypothetical protein
MNFTVSKRCTSVVSLKFVQEIKSGARLCLCHSRASAFSGARGIPDSETLRAAAVCARVTNQGCIPFNHLCDKLQTRDTSAYLIQYSSGYSLSDVFSERIEDLVEEP